MPGQMDPFLADLYGTREAIGAVDDTDQEKIAEAEFIHNMCQSEGLSIDDLSDEDVVKIAYDIWGTNSEIVKMAAEEESEEEEEGEEESEEESAEKQAMQADQLGRIMAHSFTQERAFIEKEAGRLQAAGAALEKVPAYLASKAKAAPEAVKGLPRALKSKVEAMQRSYRAGRPGTHLMPGQSKMTKLKGELSGLKKMVKEHKGTVGAAAAVPTAAAIGALALSRKKKGKKKTSSAFDTLAEQRALEMLKEAGYDVDGRSEEEKLAQAIDERAIEMLAEAGYLDE